MIVILLITVVVGITAFGFYLYFSQDRMIFYPTRDIEITPDEAGIEYEDIFIEVAPGVRINAWYFPRRSDGGGESPPDYRRTVLFCHGNGGNISHRLETVEVLLDLGVDVLLFDYRGYGRSDGSPSEANLYVDAIACLDWLSTVKNVPSESVVVFGRSLGGAVAIDLARRRSCAGLIVESSFTSAADMGRLMFPYFPVGVLLKHGFDSVEKIDRVNCPVLVMHSPDDEMIPFRMGQTLFERAKEPKEFVSITGPHNEREFLSDQLYLAALRRLVYAGAGPEPAKE